MRRLVLTGCYPSIWLHIPNEGKRHRIVGAILRSLGLITGVPDYLFVHPTAGGGFLEFKSTKGVQTDTQKEFQKWCFAFSIPYAVVRSTPDALGKLKDWGFIE